MLQGVAIESVDKSALPPTDDPVSSEPSLIWQRKNQYLLQYTYVMWTLSMQAGTVENVILHAQIQYLTNATILVVL